MFGLHLGSSVIFTLHCKTKQCKTERMFWDFVRRGGVPEAWRVRGVSSGAMFFLSRHTKAVAEGTPLLNGLTITLDMA